jgi:hypothetical protein
MIVVITALSSLKLYQGIYFYKILTSFDKFKIMSEVANDKSKKVITIYIITCFINYYLIE